MTEKTNITNYVQWDRDNSTADASSNTTVSYFLRTPEVECPYAKKCIDFQKRCDSCRHNTNRSFYEPDYPYRDDYPWYPSYPYPYITWYTTTTPYCNSGDDLIRFTTNCYGYTA